MSEEAEPDNAKDSGVGVRRGEACITPPLPGEWRLDMTTETEEDRDKKRHIGR